MVVESLRNVENCKKNFCLLFKTDICLVSNSWHVFVVTNKKKYDSHLGNIICKIHFSIFVKVENWELWET